MDSEKHPDFFTFWWELGGAWKGYRLMETAQKERQLYPPLLLPWPAGSKPLERTAVNAWYGQSQPGLAGKDGEE